MASASTLSDGGYIIGTYSVTIDGYAYDLDTLDHDLPVKTDEVVDTTGLFKGSAEVVQRQKISVKIFAITGTPAPSQLVTFSKAFHGYAAKYWKVAGLKIASSTAANRVYSAELLESKNA